MTSRALESARVKIDTSEVCYAMRDLRLVGKPPELYAQLIYMRGVASVCLETVCRSYFVLRTPLPSSRQAVRPSNVREVQAIVNPHLCRLARPLCSKSPTPPKERPSLSYVLVRLSAEK